MSKPVEQLIENIYQTFKIDMRVYQDSKLILNYQSPHRNLKYADFIESLFKDLLDHNEPRKNIILQTHTQFELTLACFNKDDYIYLIGPFFNQEYSIEHLNSLKIFLKADIQLSRDLTHIYDSLPVISMNQLHFINQLINTYEAFDVENIIVKIEKKSSYTQIAQPNYAQIEDIERETVEHNYLIEHQMMDAIYHGSTKRVNQLMKMTSEIRIEDRIEHDSLRNIKNKLIILNTISTRQAIAAGADLYRIHKLSTYLGTQIERFTSTIEANQYSSFILKTFAQEVQDYQIKKYPKVVQNTLRYIFNHINDSISTEDIANELYISKEHLSRTVKQVLGQTVNDTIHYYKILEAKKLISQNDLTFLDISQILGYSSPAHFTLTFKKVIGMTPQDYKKSLKQKLDEYQM